MSSAIRKHLRDFLAIVALMVLALATVGVILVQQRAALPSWVPVLGSDRFELSAAFTSAQAVTPGQGQTVNIAGIAVGDVSGVRLDGGEAVVSMEIDNRYAALIHPNASLLLRPRTGLNDMTLELDPGTGTRQIAEGSTVPLAATQPNVQPDQILASLDGDTRGFLQLLLSGGARGLYGHARQLSSGLRRFEPTAHDLALINGALARRRENLRHVIHDFGLLSQELSQHDQDLANLVTSSNSVFGSFAHEQAALQDAIRRFPGALDATRGALESSNRFSLAAAPALRRLIPAAHALAPALRKTRPFLRQTRKPIRDQIRPFTRQVRTPLRHVAQSAAPLADTAKSLTGAFDGLNRLLNVLAYDPAGADQSVLFFLAWLGHNTNSVFLTQDANGPIARGLVLQSCQTSTLAEGVASTRPFLRTLQQLTNVPTHAQIQASGGC